ncbi:glycolate oxidase subunit GlcE [Oxalobacteraceae bacterium R-40]|uniref:Glycolate oxidase subunit GlcE n=1 Tax=Keguizhuia sedimenti TaxID=3064264 RepID=A0ABU1BRZ4_9BURK|nr:glycolate oxidase subunit GlcE [Oxalobacteraceae bacterium R-40]
MNSALQEIRERIIAANTAGTPLRIRGGGTKEWYGQSALGDVLDTRAYAGVISYEPTELVITARCGTPLAEIDATLAEQNQMLAFEPPYFGNDATIGGVVASGLSGPRRQAAGAVRDFVLGTALMNGRGQLMHFGGQVMKNVAGYDVSRLLAGSLGTLGLIAEVSLKVLPRPIMETTLQFAMNQNNAITYLNQWGGQPLPLSASVWHEGVLRVRLSGAEAAIHAARLRLGGEEVADASAYWAGLREQQHAFFSSFDESKGLWRLSVPSTAMPIALPGEQLIEWGGAQRWLKTDADAATIRRIAQEAGGHATLFRGGAKEAGVFHPLAPALAAIHRRLKTEFDPAGIFNPGRMYSEW